MGRVWLRLTRKHKMNTENAIIIGVAALIGAAIGFAIIIWIAKKKGMM